LLYLLPKSNCLKEILSAKHALTGKISVVVGTEKTLAPLAKKAKIPFVVIEDRSQGKG